MKPKTENIIIGFSVVGLLAYGVYNVYQKAQNLGKNLVVKLKSFSIPTLQSGTATVPVTLQLDNNISLGVTARNINVKVSLLQSDGTYKQVGMVSHPGSVAIVPNGSSLVTVTPQINLNNINPFKGQTVKDVFTNIFNTNSIAKFKIDWSLIAEGIGESGTLYKELTLPNLAIG